MEQVVNFIRNGTARLIGITGGAGSGKTTLSNLLGFNTYHLDDAFIGDSEYRKKLLSEKKLRSAESFLDMTAQYNWWDWDKIEEQISLMKKTNKKSIVEGAILGPPAIVNMIDIILFIYIPERVRLARMLLRDSSKRDKGQILERFHITNKSEELYYSYLNKYYPEKIYKIDEEYNFI